MSNPPLPIALITGAARRIGQALARDLAQPGWAIATHCRGSVAAADQLAAEINQSGGKAAVLRADLASTAEVQALVPACIDALGPPSCLINNAALFLDDEIATLDPAVWDAQMAVNLRAPVLLAKA